MTRIELPLKKLSLAQKLDLMEAIWADLSGDEDKFESPQWHESILKERSDILSKDPEIVLDWDEAKSHIRKNLG
jgi:hypothetical protein